MFSVNQHLCPCCSEPLLRHVSSTRIYWFCSQCHQEMPDLKNLVKTEVKQKYRINNNITEHHDLEEGCGQREDLYSCIEINKTLHRLAFSDSLTQVANRRHFEAALDQEWRRMAREQAPLSLIIADIDFFKLYNDTHGHPAGDQCLQQVAQAIVNAVKRPGDLVARYGGEEFVVLLPNTKAEGAVRVAEEIRSAVKALEIVQASSRLSKYLTLSLGVASLIPSNEYSPAMLINAADQALYEAKAQGRDRVILHETLLRQIIVVEQEKTLALQHSNGTAAVPRRGEKFGAATQTKLLMSIESDKKLQPFTFSDSLIQIANRRRLEIYLDQEWRCMAREQAPLSLIIADFDFFKLYNDTYGHQAGDQCLQQTAKAIDNAVKRPADVVPRYGGEEFFVILPNTTAEVAVRVAEEIRSGVKALEIPQSNSKRSKYLTLSLGVASLIPSDEYSPAILINAADQALYEAKTQGRDRVILQEILLGQTTAVEPEKTLALPPSNDTAPVLNNEENIGAATKIERLMSYVAYYVSRGKTVISPLSGSLAFEKSVYQYWGYHRDFEDFWEQLQQRRDFRELYLEGDVYGFGEFLDGSCTVGECARCNLPIPMLEGHAYDVPNCTLCEIPCLSQERVANTESQSFEDEQGITHVVAIGAKPTDYKTLEECFSLNGFEVTFVPNPEEVTSQSLPPVVDFVLIYELSSEAEGQAWAQQLSRHPQLQGVPSVALSAKAGHGLPWMERTLGIKDYVLSPYSGDRLAHHLRQLLQPHLRPDTSDLYWFPR